MAAFGGGLGFLKCDGCRAHRIGEAEAVGLPSPEAGARACLGARGVTAVTQDAFARQGRPGARGAAATGLAWLAKLCFAPRRAEAGAARALAERAEQAGCTGRDSRTSSTEPSGAMHGAGPGLFFWGRGPQKNKPGAPLPPPSPRPHAADAADMRQTRGILIPNGHISYRIIFSYHIDTYGMI